MLAWCHDTGHHVPEVPVVLGHFLALYRSLRSPRGERRPLLAWLFKQVGPGNLQLLVASIMYIIQDQRVKRHQIEIDSPALRSKGKSAHEP